MAYALLGSEKWTTVSHGAGEGNRTLVVSLGSFCSTIELHPRSLHFTRDCCDLTNLSSGRYFLFIVARKQIRTVHVDESDKYRHVLVVMSLAATCSVVMSMKWRNNDISARHVAASDITSHSCRQNRIL